MINTIIDIYHGNRVDFQAVKNAGILAVLHKATEGVSTRDSTYRQRREQAKALGFLWGAFHFSSGGSVSEQVENFLTHARPQDDEVMALDWEPSSNGPDMTLEQARHFVQTIKDETGRYPIVYGGHTIREAIGHSTDPILAKCPLWYARYANAPIGIPTQVWPTYTLWQYTDGDNGPQPHHTPGVGGADRNIFQGTAAELAAQWPFTHRTEGAPNGAGFAAVLEANGEAPEVNAPAPAHGGHGGPGNAADRAKIPRAREIANTPAEYRAVQREAADELLRLAGEDWPHDGCAINLSDLLQKAGIDVPNILQALGLGDHLRDERGWQVIPNGEQQPGDVGSTCGPTPHHGFDHIYMVLERRGGDEMLVADNQEPQPHTRYVSGRGKTPTKFFLRA